MPVASRNAQEWWTERLEGQAEMCELDVQLSAPAQLRRLIEEVRAGPWEGGTTRSGFY